MNPPFGGWNGHIPWLVKFIKHGNGIGIARAYTSSGWWHEYMKHMNVICFPKGETKFIKLVGSVGKAPDSGVALFSMGEFCSQALINSKLVG